jgi:hypothetical protein
MLAGGHHSTGGQLTATGLELELGVRDDGLHRIEGKLSLMTNLYRK